jgi:hypothetical protein
MQYAASLTILPGIGYSGLGEEARSSLTFRQAKRSLSSRDFYLKEHWESESDYTQHNKDGIGGVLGFDDARQHGFT